VIVLDTVVLVYAVGAAHPLREPCRRVVAGIADGRTSATTTVEVIQEFVHVASRRHDRRAVSGLARRYATLLTPLLTSTADALDDALALFERIPELGAFDALLAATTIRSGAEGLVSADRDFAAVRGLRVLEPGSAELEAMLGEA
jgi:predicted nucleic acid-binding protein